MAGRDTRTRFQGVYARHQATCTGSEHTACDCTPRYYGRVYDRATKRYRMTKRFATVSAAQKATRELRDMLDRDELPMETTTRLQDAFERFSRAAREGRALTKHGRRYEESAIADVEQAIRVHVLSRPDLARRRLGDLRRRDVQALVDELAPTLSGSRVRTVVNALRTLYRWAQERDLVDHDPAQHVRLPAMNATPRDRVATPTEMAALLGALKLEDAIPYALAVYGMGRRGQIQRIEWDAIDLERGLVGWPRKKSDASQRVVPMVKPLWSLMRQEWMRQGQPTTGKVCPPRYTQTRSQLLNTGSLQTRAVAAWEKAKLQPIGLHECRHTAATWLDHAGVSPKIASVLMGHETPERQPGAAHITLARYTHVLPDAYEHARLQLDAWIADQLQAGSRAAGQ